MSSGLSSEAGLLMGVAVKVTEVWSAGMVIWLLVETEEGLTE